jgi:hypothetical protein
MLGSLARAGGFNSSIVQTSPVGNGFRAISVLNIVGSAVVAIGTFFPYVLITISGNFGSQRITRNAWELGSNRSVTLTSGPLIIIFAALLFANECRFISGRVRQAGPQLQITMFSNIAVLAILVLLSWPAKWPNQTGTMYERGFGGWISFCGIAMCLAATALHYVYYSRGQRSSKSMSASP